MPKRTSKLDLPVVYTLSQTGEIKNLSKVDEKTYVMLDSNVYKRFREHAHHAGDLSTEYRELFMHARRLTRKYWNTRRDSDKFLPIEGLLAAFELTRQHVKPDVDLYVSEYRNWLRLVFGIENVSPDWIASMHQSLAASVSEAHSTLSKAIESFYDVAARHKLSDITQARSATQTFFRSVETFAQGEGVSLGYLNYVLLCALFGSVPARKLVKFDEALRGDKSLVASNIGWDLFFASSFKLNASYNSKISSAFFCTEDKQLANVLRASSLTSRKRYRQNENFSPADFDLEAFKSIYRDGAESKLRQKEQNDWLESEILNHDSIMQKIFNPTLMSAVL